jgi:glycosyltransferase involved in cell wall biosynthesis
MSRPIRVCLLVVDDRFERERDQPFFGTAPTALFQGFAALGKGEVEVHVISCVKTRLPAPQQLAENIFYHQAVLPHWSYLRAGHAGPLFAVRRILRALQPDIVHAQGTERWCAVSGAFCGFPRVLTIHGNLRLINKVSRMEPRLYWKAQEILETITVPRFDGVVCITDYTRRNIADLAKRTWIVPNAVDQSFFDLYPQNSGVNRAGDTLKILFVGHIQERKNQNAFIDAVSPLAKRHSLRVRFFGQCGGDTAFVSGFKARIARHEWCSYEGMKGRDDLREAFRGASLLVLPSLEDNCPMSVLEAMAAGIPIVASRVGGVPELIKDGVTGLLCDPLDRESMRSCVERILTAPQEASSMAVAARAVARDRYHPSVIAAKHIEVYREVIART